MLNLYRWQTGPALLVAFSFVSSAIAPLTTAQMASAKPAPQAIAQLFPDDPYPQPFPGDDSPENFPDDSYPQPLPGDESPEIFSGDVRRSVVAIPEGTSLPVRYEKAEKVVVARNETLPLTLVIARNIRSASGQMLIPAGSEVRGELQPADGGSQFIANELILTDDTRYFINAASDVVETTQEIRPGVDTGSVLKGAAIGAGAATIISGITGKKRITFGKILIGAGVGAAGGALLGKRRESVVVIEPDRDLTLTLNTQLALD